MYVRYKIDNLSHFPSYVAMDYFFAKTQKFNALVENNLFLQIKKTYVHLIDIKATFSEINQVFSMDFSLVVQPKILLSST